MPQEQEQQKCRQLPDIPVCQEARIYDDDFSVQFISAQLAYAFAVRYVAECRLRALAIYLIIIITRARRILDHRIDGVFARCADARRRIGKNATDGFCAPGHRS